MISGAQQMTIGDTETGGRPGGPVDFWLVNLAGGDELNLTVTASPATSNYFHVELFNPGTTDSAFQDNPPVNDVATNNTSGPQTLTLWAPYSGSFVLAICEGYGVSDCRGRDGYEPADPMTGYTIATGLADGGIGHAKAAAETAPSGTIAHAQPLNVGDFESGGGLESVDFWRIHLVGGERDDLDLSAQDANYFHVELYPGSTTDTSLPTLAPFDYLGTNNTPGPAALTVQAPYTGTFILAICEGYGVGDCSGSEAGYSPTAPMTPYSFTQTLAGGGIGHKAAAGETQAASDIASARSLTLGNYEAGGAQAVDFWRVHLDAGEQVIVSITPSLPNYFLFQLFPPSTTNTTFLSATPAVSIGTNNLYASDAFTITAPYAGNFTLAVCQGYGVGNCADVLYKNQGTNPMSPYTFATAPIVDPTSTALTCSPTSLEVGSRATCTATVTDTASKTVTTPAGTVKFTASPASGTFGSSASCPLTAAGATGVASCKITFTPSGSGSYRITGAYSGDSGHVASSGRSAPVSARTPLGIKTTSLPAGAKARPYTATLVAEGGNGSHSWNVASGKLPPGLGMAPSGDLSGTPTTPGSYAFTVRVSDSDGQTATHRFSIKIAEIAISTSSLPPGRKGARYLVKLAVYGGKGKLTWSLAGHLPKGLALSRSGTITGKPETAGTFSLDIKVTDHTGATATRRLVLVIHP